MESFAIKNLPGGYKFDVKARNGEIVASSESYRSLAACRKGIAAVMAAAQGPVHDLTAGEIGGGAGFEVFADRRGRFRFRLKSRNGRIVAVSESYAAKDTCLRGIAAVRSAVGEGARLAEET